jgi:gas vesicle protein
MAEDNSGKVLWFVAGAAIGATIALLYAPQSGEETREYIRKKAGEGRDRLADVSDDLVGKGRDLYERGRRVADDAADLFERGKRALEG